MWLGWWLYSLVMNLQAFGMQMENAGAGFRGTMTNIGDNLGGIWVIGDSIRTPFDAASAAGRELEQAGQAQQESVHNLALGLGIGIAFLPVLTILIFWLVPRIRFAIKASKAKAMLAHENSRDLLALRALCGQKLSALAAVDPDPAGAWRARTRRCCARSRASSSVVGRPAGLGRPSPGEALP